jgi:hypothetical protein
MVMMKPISISLAVFGGLSIFLFLISHTTVKAALEKPIQESNHNLVILCLPGINYSDSGDCASAGPSAYLTCKAETGITFPLTLLPADQTNSELVQSDIRYGEVVTKNAPAYPNTEAAVQGQSQLATEKINASFVHISNDR